MENRFWIEISQDVLEKNVGEKGNCCRKNGFIWEDFNC